MPSQSLFWSPCPFPAPILMPVSSPQHTCLEPGGSLKTPANSPDWGVGGRKHFVSCKSPASLLEVTVGGLGKGPLTAHMAAPQLCLTPAARRKERQEDFDLFLSLTSSVVLMQIHHPDTGRNPSSVTNAAPRHLGTALPPTTTKPRVSQKPKVSAKGHEMQDNH